MSTVDAPDSVKILIAATSLYNRQTKHFYHSWAIQLYPEIENDNFSSPHTYCALRSKDQLNPDADKKIGITNLFKREGYHDLIYSAIAEVHKILSYFYTYKNPECIIYLTERSIIGNFINHKAEFLEKLEDEDIRKNISGLLLSHQPKWRFISDASPEMRELQMIANKKAIEFENAHVKSILERIYQTSTNRRPFQD